MQCLCSMSLEVLPTNSRVSSKDSLPIQPRTGHSPMAKHSLTPSIREQTIILKLGWEDSPRIHIIALLTPLLRLTPMIQRKRAEYSIWLPCLCLISCEHSYRSFPDGNEGKNGIAACG